MRETYPLDTPAPSTSAYLCGGSRTKPTTAAQTSTFRSSRATPVGAEIDSAATHLRMPPPPPPFPPQKLRRPPPSSPAAPTWKPPQYTSPAPGRTLEKTRDRWLPASRPSADTGFSSTLPTSRQTNGTSAFARCPSRLQTRFDSPRP